MTVAATATRWAVRWTQPNGQTGLGDSYAAYARANEVANHLTRRAEQKWPPQYRMRYTVEPVT